jgi:Mrp family chromosome partitioning ATPase
MAEDRPRFGSSFPPVPSGRSESDGPVAKPARSGSRPPYVQHPTVRGMPTAAPPNVAEPESPSGDSWAGKTVLAIDEISRPPQEILAPARIISVGPAAPEPPIVNAYAVRDSEQTLLDHDPPFVESSNDDAGQSPQRVAAAEPGEESEPAVQSRPLAVRPPGKRWASQLIDPHLVLLLEPYSQRSASFRALRDSLLAKNAPRLIAVSSSAEYEGKTTCAINLALALVERPSTRVLLLEGNFYCPELARIFHITDSTPFAPEMNLPWLLPYRVVEVAHGFHVAAVVQRDGEPAPIFNGRWFDMVMGHLAEADYDFLIVDAPALDGSSPVMHIVGIAEGTLLTVRSGRTTARMLRRAAEQIPRGRGLGVTLMDSE